MMKLKSVLFSFVIFVALFITLKEINALPRPFVDELIRGTKNRVSPFCIKEYKEGDAETTITIIAYVEKVKIVDNFFPAKTRLEEFPTPCFSATKIFLWAWDKTVPIENPIILYGEQPQVITGRQIKLVYTEKLQFYGKEKYTVNLLKYIEILSSNK